MTLLELLLQLLQLIRTEGRAIPPELGLLGAVQAGIVLAVVVVSRRRVQQAVLLVRRRRGPGRAGHDGGTGPAGGLQPQRAVGPQGRVPREGGRRGGVGVGVVEAVAGGSGELRRRALGCAVAEDSVDAAYGWGSGVRADT